MEILACKKNVKLFCCRGTSISTVDSKEKRSVWVKEEPGLAHCADSSPHCHSSSGTGDWRPSQFIKIISHPKHEHPGLFLTRVTTLSLSPFLSKMLLKAHLLDICFPYNPPLLLFGNRSFQQTHDHQLRELVFSTT